MGMTQDVSGQPYYSGGSVQASDIPSELNKAYQHTLEGTDGGTSYQQGQFYNPAVSFNIPTQDVLTTGAIDATGPLQPSGSTAAGINSTTLLIGAAVVVALVLLGVFK